ncbi:MAG: tetratricopeptide repeat protein [Melioribacteraceae bacterium]|nr:tetratricopeptide repeat protein [Melioribacteraceae bacterium]
MKKSKPDKKSGQTNNRLQSISQIPGSRLWLFRLVALVGIPIIFFSLLEFSLRLIDFGYTSAALIKTNGNDTDYVRDNSAFAYRFFPRQLAPEFVPLRFKADKPDGVFRIFILGGSAAQGIPDPAYSFGRILDVMLQVRYPDEQFEIFSLAMTAINSHVVLEIAKDCAEYDPDLIVVYMGNNEVIGPYGPGSVFSPIISNGFLLDLTISLKTTKIAQLLTLGMEKLNILGPPYKRWKGMEMFLQNQVQINDPMLEVTYRNFKDNLEELNQIAYDNNIKIIYSTVVSNLKDNPPFNSVHSEDLQTSDMQKWNDLYFSGSAYEEAGDYKSAIAKYLEAMKIDSLYADLHYRLGKCYWHTGSFVEAGESYKRAREYDNNRFRADDRINEIIRNAAAEITGTTFLADALAAIEQQSPYRISGKEFLHEHVHLNFKGNYQIALTVLNELEQMDYGILKDQRPENTVQISDSLCAAHLAYNNYEHHRIRESVLNGFIKEPPFTNQLYHSETVEKLENELDSLRNVIQVLGLNETESNFEFALRERPSDWLLHNKFADFLASDEVRKYRKALEHFQFVLEQIPHDYNAYVKRGVVLGKLGRLQESLDDFQRALKINPAIAGAYFNSGLIYQKLNKNELAVESYEKAVYYEPAHSKAYNNLAFIFSRQGDVSKTFAIIEEGLINSPDDLLLNYNKAIYLYKFGRKQEAIEQLRHTAHFAPGEMMIQNKLNEWLRKEN